MWQIKQKFNLYRNVKLYYPQMFYELSLFDAAMLTFLLLNIYLLIISVLASFNNKSPDQLPSSPSTTTSESESEPTKKDNILLVIAHPDDESMFFVPTITTLVHNSNVYILCLSTGNYDGLGETRTKELYASGLILGIQQQNIHIINDPLLQDGKNNQWLQENVAKQIDVAVKLWSINKIITFDEYGVSGHENHIDTSRGVVYYYQTYKWGDETRPSTNYVYQLESTNICRKYAGVLDVMYSLTQQGSQCFCSLTPWINYAAMQAHFSQFVWYRRLFVLFSRYTYCNNLIKLMPRGKGIDIKKRK